MHGNEDLLLRQIVTDQPFIVADEDFLVCESRVHPDDRPARHLVGRVDQRGSAQLHVTLRRKIGDD